MQNTDAPACPKPRIRRSTSEIASLLEEYRSSGLTQRAFASSRGVSLSTLSSWLRHRQSEAPEKPRLVPVEITDSATSSLRDPEHAYSLSLPGGLRLSIPPEFDEGSLRRLLTLLSERC